MVEVKHAMQPIQFCEPQFPHLYNGEHISHFTELHKNPKDNMGGYAPQSAWGMAGAQQMFLTLNPILSTNIPGELHRQQLLPLRLHPPSHLHKHSDTHKHHTHTGHCS